MHIHSIDGLEHEHLFLGRQHARNEQRTWAVVALTAVMMVVEIVGGYLFGSMALVADGWHMSTHAAALGIAGLAYRFARTHAHDPRFSFGTGKLGELAGYSSAIILAMIALWIGVESAARLFQPVAISFGEAIPIAVLGLGVNLASAWLLGAGHGHDHADHDDEADDHDHDGHSHDHDHDHDQQGHHDDHNFRAAYVHVLSDALTSVLAIAALVAGLTLGWTWMDPLMGLVGTVVIAAWAWSLLRSAGAVLLDMVPNPRLAEAVRERLEVGGDRLCDLHLWRVGPGHTAAVITVLASEPREPAAYKARLAGLAGLSHITVEVLACKAGVGMPCSCASAQPARSP
jgi:cation diffusion facilitator family transporter